MIAQLIASLCPLNVSNCAPVVKFQMIALVSLLAVKIIMSLGLKTAAVTISVCAARSMH